MTARAARSKLACRIAGIDPLRLNELIHAGVLPCAPTTVPGRARVFEIDDIVALKVFVVLSNAGFSHDRAGYYACEVRDQIRQRPDAGYITILISQNGIDVTATGTVGEEEYPAPITRKAVDLGICIRDLRLTVEEELERESRILGDE